MIKKRLISFFVVFIFAFLTLVVLANRLVFADCCCDNGGYRIGEICVGITCSCGACGQPCCADGPHSQCLCACPPACSPNCGCASSTCQGFTCSDGCGGTCAGTKVCCTPVAPAVPVPTPAVVNGTSATLSWSLSSWGTGCNGTSNNFRVLSDQNPNPSTEVYFGPSTSAGLSSLAGGIHYWKVRAENSSLSSAYSPVQSFCVKQAPSQPHCYSGSTTSNDYYQISWDPPEKWGYGCPDGKRYEVYYYSIPEDELTSFPGNPIDLYDPSSDFVKKIDIADPGETEYLLSNLPDATFYWQIRAINTQNLALNPGQVNVSGTCEFVVDYEKDSWWQTEDGDLHSRANISSPIPDTLPSDSQYLSLAGEGGSPGVVSFGGGLHLGNMGGEVSDLGWAVNTSLNGINMGFDYLVNRLKVDKTVIFEGSLGSALDGRYYIASGSLPLSLAGSDLGTKKIVLFVEKDVEVTGNITVSPGGFFALIAKGNISFTPEVTQAHGFYLSDNLLVVKSSAKPENGLYDSQFVGEGSFVGLAGINFNRNLGERTLNRTTPGVLVVSRPDFFINAPAEFMVSRFPFQELAP